MGYGESVSRAREKHGQTLKNMIMVSTVSGLNSLLIACSDHTPSDAGGIRNNVGGVETVIARYAGRLFTTDIWSCCVWHSVFKSAIAKERF